MAVTTIGTVEVAQALAALLEAEGLRVWWYVPDTARPPCVVIGQPDIDFQDPGSGYCYSRWEFPLTVVVARNNDRDGQSELSAMVTRLAGALDVAGYEPGGLFSIEPLDARPTTAVIGGQELPAYQVRVAVRA